MTQEEIQKNINKRIGEKDINIAIGQGANCATEFMKVKGFDKKEFKDLARQIADVILELRGEYTQAPENNDTEPA
jgi:HD-like signal output (HDOD) protein